MRFTYRCIDVGQVLDTEGDFKWSAVGVGACRIT